MKYRTLGTTTISVSEISLGCWTMGGLNWVNGVPNGWANVDEKEIASAVDYAIDHGVNSFDTADVYGNGRSERMLSRILGKRTSNVIIATKVGHFPGTAEHAYDPLHIRHQCEQSLKNLSRDHIDVYYFHHGDFGKSDRYLDDAVAVIQQLKKEGKIRAIGQSAYSNEDFLRVVPKVNPDVLQSSASVMDDHYIADGSPVRKLLEERKMSFIAFGPLGQGLLLGKYSKSHPPKFEPGDHRANAPRFSQDNLAKLEPKLQRLKEKFSTQPEHLARAALQYLLHYKVVGAVIPGFRNLAQVKVNLSAADNPLTEEEFAFIKTAFAS